MFPQAGMAGGNRPRPMQGNMLIAQVVRTYLPDDPEHPALRRGLTTIGTAVNLKVAVPLYDPTMISDVVCDVVPFGSGRRLQAMQFVPILRTGGFGLDDADVPWIPRAARLALFGGVPLPAGIPGAATQPNDADGDIVVVGFLHGDAQRPVILGAMAHPRSRVVLPTTRIPSPTIGSASERLVQHRGVKVKIDSDGNVEVDATGATSGATAAGAVPILGTGGNVAVKVAAGRSVTFQTGIGNATKLVARVGDTTGGSFPITTPLSTNPGWAELLPLLGGLLTAALVPVPPNVQARLGLTWADVTAAMASGGLGATIASGHANVRTD